MMQNQLQALRLFMRVAHTGNFSKAARDCGLSQPQTSRMVAALEEELGASLFRRSTRSVTLTDVGADYLARIEPILASLDAADYLVRQPGEIRGCLRVSAPLSVGTRIVMPLVPDFLARHPELSLDLAVSNVAQDPEARPFDVVFLATTGDAPCTSARMVRTWPRILIASPRFLSRTGPLAAPEDLAGLSRIVCRSTVASSWICCDGLRSVAVHLDNQLTVSSEESGIAAAVAGAGIAAAITPTCQYELDTGRLQQVLSGWTIGHVALYLTTAGARKTPEVRMFTDYVLDRLGEEAPAGAVLVTPE
jgi:DNA-binding transcriptional LysR family regulator